MASGGRLPTVDPGLLAELERVVPAGVRARPSDRLAMAHDASHYLLTPQVVVTPERADQIGALLRMSRRTGVAVTFRSGGTSLSGQASTDAIMVDTRRHFRGVEVLDDGRRVRVRPGTTLRRVNASLAPHGRRLGPDPASEIACTIGGVIANNSSGMTCGTEFNTYRTIDSAVVVLASGTVIDTGRDDADDELRTREPELHAGLLRLRDRVRADPASVRVIEHQFSMKNTMGYAVNAFLDFSTASEILTHLIVGSEGTLGFVAEAVFRTVPRHEAVATGLLLFPDLRAATAALPALVESQLAAIELLDAGALAVARQDVAARGMLGHGPQGGAAALLVEHQEPSAAALDARVTATSQLLDDLPLTMPCRLSSDPATRARLWHVRKGLYAAVSGDRPPGTTALLEDVAVPVPVLADTCEELEQLFEAFDYRGSIVFGHAKDGNLHFMLNENFSDAAQLDRYASFTESMVELVLSKRGNLKAEHGTGRIMAPFVARQYGDELYRVMREVKRLFDPHLVLNPGIVISDDPTIYVRDLKTVEPVEPEVDRCVECGYCEPVCPSQDLTLTPRQRIVLRREEARAARVGDDETAHQIREAYRYEGLDTCAVDGMCQTACPVQINTGDLVRRLRAGHTTRGDEFAWKQAASHWSTATRVAGTALTVARRLPPGLPHAATRAARHMLSDERVPLWEADIPGGGRPRRPSDPQQQAEAVLFPSCMGTVFDSAEGSTGVTEAMLRLAQRAGVSLRVPEGIASLCCGTPWKSKGLHEGHRRMAERLLPAMWQATERGRLPIVSDASSCTEGLDEMLSGMEERFTGKVQVIDAVSFTARSLLPRLTVRERLPSLALHPTCSSTRLGLDHDLQAVADAIADEVVVAPEWMCCAFAGDRGMLHPELTAAATCGEAAAVNDRPFAEYASVNRTCEMGLARATGRPYRHLLEILERVT